MYMVIQNIFPHFILNMRSGEGSGTNAEWRGVLKCPPEISKTKRVRKTHVWGLVEMGLIYILAKFH